MSPAYGILCMNHSKEVSLRLRFVVLSNVYLSL